MAKLTGPLMSLSASGTIADALTFRTQNGRAVVHKKMKPRLRQSQAQQERQAIYAGICSTWNTLSELEKSLWTAQGAFTNITGFNAYCSSELLAAYDAAPTIALLESSIGPFLSNEPTSLDVSVGDFIVCAYSCYVDLPPDIADSLGNTYTMCANSRQNVSSNVNHAFYTCQVTTGGTALIDSTLNRDFRTLRAMKFSGLDSSALVDGVYSENSGISPTFSLPDGKHLVLSVCHTEPSAPPTFTGVPDGATVLFNDGQWLTRPILYWLIDGAQDNVHTEINSTSVYCGPSSTIFITQ